VRFTLRPASRICAATASQEALPFLFLADQVELVIGLPGLGHQRGRLRGIGHRRADVGVVLVHRADMVVRGDDAGVAVAEFEHRGVVDGELQGPADADVVIGRRVLVQPHHQRLRRGDAFVHRARALHQARKSGVVW
jgi:hypothetical protein